MSRAGLLRTIACLAALGGALAVIPACDFGIEGADYPVAYGDSPDGCIATTEAVYYNGYPSYWCGGLWYFRGEGGRWGHYGREPPGLDEHRMGGGPGRRNYENTSRPSGGGRGGGGRGGGGRGGGGGGHR
jgi:hypothetical protein